MTIYEAHTEISPAEVIQRALDFFVGERSPYAAFPVQVGPDHLRLALEVGEVTIGTTVADGVTRIRASSSRGAHLLTRFLSSIAAERAVQRKPNRLITR